MSRNKREGFYYGKSCGKHRRTRGYRQALKDLHKFIAYIEDAEQRYISMSASGNPCSTPEELFAALDKIERGE